MMISIEKTVGRPTSVGGFRDVSLDDDAGVIVRSRWR